MSKFRRITVTALAVVLTASAVPAFAAAARLVTISGATASYPLVQLLAQRYVKLHQHSHQIHFKITQGGAQVGINDVAARRVSIADVSRDPIASDKGKDLYFYPIAKYAICPITNTSNPLANLTEAKLTAIFTGAIKNWSEVPGATASGPIDVISRTSVAGVLSSFKTLLLEGKSVEKSATETSSEGLMKQAVKNDHNSIGFISNYQVETGGVHAVAVNGVACNKANARSGSYPGVAHFYEVTKGAARGAASWFISWIDHSVAARNIINTKWISIH